MQRVAAAMVVLLVTALLYLFLRRTWAKYSRHRQQPQIGRTDGHSLPHRVLAISFGIGTMLAAVSGGLLIWQSKHKRCISTRPTVNCWISLQRN